MENKGFYVVFFTNFWKFMETQGIFNRVRSVGFVKEMMIFEFFVV